VFATRFNVILGPQDVSGSARRVTMDEILETQISPETAGNEEVSEYAATLIHRSISR